MHAHPSPSIMNKENTSNHSDGETIALYEFEEVEDQSVQMKKKLFLTDFLLTNDDRNDDSSKGPIFSKLAKFISTIYDAYIKSSDKLTNDESNVNYRQAIIEKYQQNWSIEYTTTGLYTLKDSTLKLHNEDLVPITSVKSLEWMDSRKILSVTSNFVSVTNCDDGKIRIYSSDLKSQLASVDLSKFLHFDKSPLFRTAISNVKLLNIAGTESNRFDILFQYDSSLYQIPMIRDVSTINLYRIDVYSNQIEAFDVHEAENGEKMLAIVLANSQQECVFLEYPEDGSKFISIPTSEKKKSTRRKISLEYFKNQNDLFSPKQKMIFSPDGSYCAFLSSSKKFFIYRVPFPFIDDSQVVASSSLENILEFNWWSPSSVILCNDNNEMYVIEISSKKNILGDGDVTEDIEGIPFISTAHNGKFFLLEYDPNITQLKIDQQLLLLQEQQRLTEKLQNSSESSLLSAFSTLFSFLFPKVAPPSDELKEENMIPSTLSLAYRVYRFYQKTPEKEFSEKLHQGDLEEALSLAKTFSLDMDEVYKKMWRRHVISVESIAKLQLISDKMYILNECVCRIASNEEVMRHLLECGLAISNTLLSEETNCTDLSHRSSVLKNCSEKAKEILEARRKLLLYLDRLDLFLDLSPQQVYKGDQYHYFRDCNIVSYAKERASMKDFSSLKAIISYCLPFNESYRVSRNLNPHDVIDIISCIPESVPPNEYKDLLPGVEKTGNCMTKWSTLFMRRKEQDYSEKLMEKPQVDYPSSQEITEWYLSRAEAIDVVSGMVSYAESLLEIGIKRNVKRLEDKLNELNFMSLMIYNRGNLFNLNKQLLSVKEYESNLTNFDKFKLLINKTSTDIVSQILNKGLNFISHCEEEEKTGKDSLLYKYMLQELAPHLLYQCAKIFEYCSGPNAIHLFSDNDVLAMLAVECIYSCKNYQENTENIIRIINSLPTGNIHQELEQHINTIRDNTIALTVLSKYSISIPLSLSTEFEVVGKTIVGELAQKCIKSGATSDKSFQSLYSDLKTLHGTVMHHLTQQEVYSQFLKNCCLSGHAHLAYEYVTRDMILPYTDADEIIYQATAELINSSTEPTDSSIMIADKCISLHRSLLSEKFVTSSNEERWTKEINILEAFRIIGKEFSNHQPALFLRKSSIMDIVKYLIENNHTGTDEATLETFYKICRLLGGNENDRKNVKMLAIEDSLQKAESGNLEVVRALMKQNHNGIYKHCAKLCIDTKCKISSEERLEFAAYAVRNCPSSELSEMLSIYELVESHQFLSKSIPATEATKDISLSNSILIAHDMFSKLAKENEHLFSNISVSGTTPLYYSCRENSFVSHFGISPTTTELDTIFRSKLMEIQLTLTSETEKLNTQSLLDFAILSLTNGYIMSFVTILLKIPLESIDSVKKLFDSILSSQPQNTPISAVEKLIELFTLYFALRLLLLENPESLTEYYDEMSLNDIEKSLEDNEIESNECTSKLNHFLKFYNGLLYLCNHFSELSIFSTSTLSCLQFITDEKYRENVLFDLSKTQHMDQFKAALNIAQKLSMDTSKLYLNFLDCVLNKENILDSEKSFIREISSTSVKDEVVLIVKNKLTPNSRVTSGYNLPKISFLTELLVNMDLSEYTPQKALVDFLSTENLVVDFFSLTSESTDTRQIIELLKPILNHKSVNTILDLLKPIKPVETSQIYSHVVTTTLSNAKIDPKERAELVLPFISFLTQDDIKTLISKVSFDNAFKMPLAVRLSFMRSMLNTSISEDSSLANEVKSSIFKMSSAKRIFQRQELEYLLEEWDKYLRDHIDLMHVLSETMVHTKNPSCITNILQDLQEEYKNAFNITDQSDLTSLPLFFHLDTTQCYLKTVKAIVQCLVEHSEEIRKESDSEDEAEEEKLLQQHLESNESGEIDIHWPPLNAKMGCIYMKIILKSAASDSQQSQDLFNTLVNYVDTIAKDQDDLPVRTRIALVRILRDFKKKAPGTSSPVIISSSLPGGVASHDETITSSPSSNEITNANESNIGHKHEDDQTTLLAIYQTRDTVAENFPSHKTLLHSCRPPSEEFATQFEELVNMSSTDAQFRSLSFILRIWFKGKQHQEFLETLLLKVLTALVEITHVKKESILLEIALEQMELLSEQKGNEFVNYMIEKNQDLLACKFALQVKHKSTNVLALDRIQHIAESKPTLLDSDAMSDIICTCIMNGYTSTLIHMDTLLFNILHGQHLKLYEECEAQFIAELVLISFKQSALPFTLFACEYVQRKVFGMHDMFCSDLNGSLFLLRRYLQQQQTNPMNHHEDADTIVRDLCRAALQKLDIRQLMQQ
ncbi:hypothetical protein C9374_011504 [Naegleria lovaniensis]|uniref:KNTC1 first ARM-repeats domain-containing protein n=1 Tax=Naegleria lovaniensis TaxID=51637 RepID=A0AA88H344_NAELO|nr:uncharacterized protein C9374_011504 [Naegleria lovaniensis]KAG2392779.1 hypothetical protein C9374_011504 [Naegleria lovaniensis]